MFTYIHIRQFELGLVHRHGDFSRILEPGNHLVFGLNLRVQRVDCMDSQWVTEDLNRQIRVAAIADRLHVVDLSDDERAVVWRDGRVYAVLRPGLYAFWREPSRLTIERFDAREFRFQHDHLDAILALPESRFALESLTVQANETVLLYRDGQLFGELGPGRHVFWRNSGVTNALTVDLRDQYLDIQGQEIMTADKVSLRVNMSVAFRVVNAVVALREVTDYSHALYRDAQLVLRAAVGTRTLEALLSDKESIGSEVRRELDSVAELMGLELRSVGLRDIILPGEMKTLMNQVTEAQKAAEANIIRRREETAAARSQANTARLLTEHPGLMRMRELEALQEIVKGANTTFHLGGGDLLNQLHDLIGSRT